MDAHKLCLGSTCITEQQLAAVLAAANQSGSPGQQSGSHSPTTPPVISIRDANPAHITVGTSYNDNGVTAKDSAGHDLTVRTFLDGIATSSPWIDTSAAGSHTIDYVATDGAGLTSTSTRTVIVEAQTQ